MRLAAATSACILAFTAGAAGAVPPPPPGPPVIDCAATTYATERFICGDSELLARTRAVEGAYESRRHQLPPAEALKLQDAQGVWSRERNMCAFKRDQRRCVIRSTDARLKTLAPRAPSP